MSGSTSRIEPASPADIAEDNRLTALASTELPRVRATANSWRTGTSIASSVVAAAGLIGAPDALKAAAPWTVAVTGVCLLIAAVATLISISCALRASFGWPSKIQVLQVGELRAWEARELSTVVRMLTVSMIAGLAAFVFAACAFGFLYFGPRADTESAPSATPSMTATTSPSSPSSSSSPSPSPSASTP